VFKSTDQIYYRAFGHPSTVDVVAKIVQASEAAIPADQQVALSKMTMMLR
jgi:hypothetical protein